MASKKCLICKSTLSGRSDARTCSARCRKRLQLVRLSLKTSSYANRVGKSIALLVLSVFGFLLFFGSPTPQVHAVTSSYLNFQARLLNSSGSLVADGNYNVEFKIYNASSSSGSSQGSCSGDVNCLWTETRISSNQVRVVNGYLTVNLGSVTALPNISWDQQLYLSMNIGGTGSPSWDGEMSPRITLTAVPYAFQASSATQLSKTSGGNTGTLSFNTVANSPSITLPDESGTVCLQGSASCGFITSSSGVQLQGTTPGTAQTGNFNISGVGIAGTALQAPLLDTATATALAIGTTNATAINLNQNVTVAAAKTLIVTSGATSLTGATTGDALTVSNNTSTGNIAVFKDNSTTVATIADGGAVTLKNSTNSTAAFQVQNAASTSIFNVDTQNSTVAVANLTSCDTVSTNASNVLTCNTGTTAHVGKIRVFGHSYAVGYQGTKGGWAAKTAALLQSDLTNRAISGARLGIDDGSEAPQGGYATVLQKTTRTRSTAPYITNDGVGIYNFGINDVGMTPSTGQTPFKEALRTIISRDRAGAVKEDSDSSVAYGGSGGSHWSTVNDVSANSGSSYRQTSTNNDTYTISVPADFPGGTIAVGLIAGTGASGAVHSFTVDGGAAGTTDTRNIALTSKKVGMVKRFTGLSAGAHTIVGTVSSMSGQTYFDYWQIEASQAPLTVVHNVARLTSGGYTVYQFLNGGTPVTDSDVNTMNSNISSVISEFDSNVLLVDTDAQLAASSSNYDPDTIHPNDIGYSKIASATYTALKNATQTVDQLAYSSGGTESIMLKSYINNNTAFQVQNADNTPLLGVDTTVSSNIIYSSSAETVLIGWQVKGSSAVSWTNAQAWSGNNSVKIATTAATNDGAKYNLTLTNSQAYTFSFWAKTTSTSFNNWSMGYAFDGSTETTYVCSGSTLGNITSNWTRFSCSFTPTGITGTPYLFFKQTNATARNIYLDGFQVETGSSATGFNQGSIQLNGLVTSPTIFKNSSNSKEAFAIQNSAGSTFFGVDTAASQINIADNIIINLDGGLGQTFLYNSIGFNASSLVNLNSGATVNMVGDNFSVKDGTNTTTNFGLNSTGQATFKNRTNSTTAFQIQNASSAALFTADTTNQRVGIGGSPANSVLTVGTNTTTQTGGIYFGTDTYLYRNAGGDLRTNGNLRADAYVTANFQGAEVTIGYNGDTLSAASAISLGTGVILNSATDVLKTNDSWLVQPATSVADALRVNTSGGSSIFSVDTSTPKVNVADNTILDFGGGGTKFIKSVNGFGLLNISNTTASAALQIQGDNISLMNAGGTAHTTLSSTGQALFKNTSNSTTAFRIQNTSSVSLFTVDTSGSAITVGGSTTTFATLTINEAHFKATQTNAPTIGTPTNCGTSPTAAVTSASTDSAGSFRITAGTGSPTTCDTVITFNKTYGAAPKSIVLTPTTAVASATGALTAQVSATSATTFTIKFAPTNPTASQVNSFYYWVVE